MPATRTPPFKPSNWREKFKKLQEIQAEEVKVQETRKQQIEKWKQKVEKELDK